MRRPLVYVGLAVVLVVAVGIYAVATRRPIETYTVAVAGVVTVHDSAVYTLKGRAANLNVTFIADGAAQVGDLLLAGDGSPTWGYRAPPVGGGCWSVRANSRVDGAWIDADIGDSGGRPGVDIHFRIPKSDAFNSPLAADGHLLGVALCLDSTGRVISAE